MGNIERILDEKARSRGVPVVTIQPGATVLEAAQLMNQHHIGALVVTVDGGVAGIFTERDVMRRVVAAQRDPALTRVEDVMTAPVACAEVHTTLAELQRVMRDRRIRHLPVVDDERLVGIVSIGDLNRAEHESDEETIRYLEQFMSVI